MLLGALLCGVALGSMLVVSRCREYSADRGAALMTGAPEQLMSALQKIAGSVARIPDSDLRGVARMSAFAIVPTKRGSYTHPPLEERLERLAELARQLGLAEPPAAVATRRRRLVDALVAFAVAFPVFAVLGLVLMR